MTVESPTILSVQATPLTLSDIIRLFYIYTVPGLPVVDHHSRVVGIILKSHAIQFSVDATVLTRLLSDCIHDILERRRLAHVMMLYPENMRDTSVPIITLYGNVWKELSLNELARIETGYITENALIALDGYPHPVIMADINGHVTLVNRSAMDELQLSQLYPMGAVITELVPGIIGRVTPETHGKLQELDYKRIKIKYTPFLVDGPHTLYIFHSVGAHMNEATFTKKTRSSKKRTHFKVRIDFDLEDTHSLATALNTAEKNIIGEVLEAHEYNISAAARALNVPRQTLQYKISKYALGPHHA